MANQTIQSTKKILSVHDFVPNPEQVDAFKEAVFGRVDRGMDYLIFVQFMAGIIIAFYTQTWYTAVGMGVISLAIYCTFRFLFTGLSILRYLTSGLLAIFIFQYLIQLHGLVLVQWLFSLSLTVLLFYQNWRLLVPNFLVSLLYVSACFYIVKNPDSSFQSFFADLTNYESNRILSFLMMHTAQFAFCLVIALQLERRFASGVRNIIYINEQLNLEANIQLANQIASGNFEAEYEIKKNDYMGETLLSMRENLKNYREQEDRNHWINEGIARISQVLMQHNDLENLSYQTLQNVIKYTKSSQGLIYNVLKDEKKQKEYLHLLACYAYEHQEQVGKNFEIGEDLVGETVLRKQTIHIKKLPENYLSISSGLGGAMPAELVLVPLKVKDEVVGVLELGTFTAFRTSHIEFLEKIGERIATSLLSVQANQRNNDLLNEAQNLAQQLRAQEEFLKQNMEELQTTQSAITEANDKLSSLLVNVPGMIFTQRKEDATWSINFVSEGAKILTGYEPQAIVNGQVHFTDLIHPDDFKTTYQESDKIVSKAIAEKTVYEIRYRLVDAYKNVKYVWEKGNGLYDDNGQLIGLQGFVTDITSQVEVNQRMQEQLEEMQAQEEVINQTFEQMQTLQKISEDNNTELQNTLKAIDKVLVILELNPDRTVKYVNEKFCEISQYTSEEIVGKDLAFYVLEEDLANMDTLWLDLLQGQPMMREIRRLRKDKQLFWLQAYYIPTIDAKGNLVKITTMSTDITEQKNKEKELDKLLAEMKK
jgi:methyl-accepting chemotaxis protein